MNAISNIIGVIYMKRFFGKIAFFFSIVMSTILFAEQSPSPKTDSNIELILTEKKNHLGNLLIKRFALAKKIALHKWNQKLPIDNEKEEMTYLNDLSVYAKEFNIPPHLIETFFSSQLDAQKALEIQLFEAWVAQDVYKHNVDTDLSSLKEELKNIDIELLKNLQSSKELINKNSTIHLKDLATQLKENGYPRDVIDDSLKFINSSSSLK